MQPTHRPAVRIICLDSADRVLLLLWRDPFDGSLLWEPPGGGIEDGETPLLAARRELLEETGLDPAAVRAQPTPVARDFRWNGRRYVGSELLFAARFEAERPALSRAGLMPDEQDNLRGHRWVSVSELVALPERVEPAGLAELITGWATR